MLDGGKAVFENNCCSNCGYCSRVCPNSAVMGIRAGTDVYAEGQWGRDRQVGIKIGCFLSERDAVMTVGRIKDWYLQNGQEGERLGNLILRSGINAFQAAVLEGVIIKNWH